MKHLMHWLRALILFVLDPSGRIRQKLYDHITHYHNQLQSGQDDQLQWLAGLNTDQSYLDFQYQQLDLLTVSMTDFERGVFKALTQSSRLEWIITVWRANRYAQHRLFAFSNFLQKMGTQIRTRLATLWAKVSPGLEQKMQTYAERYPRLSWALRRFKKRSLSIIRPLHRSFSRLTRRLASLSPLIGRYLLWPSYRFIRLLFRTPRNLTRAFRRSKHKARQTTASVPPFKKDALYAMRSQGSSMLEQLFALNYRDAQAVFRFKCRYPLRFLRLQLFLWAKPFPAPAHASSVFTLNDLPLQLWDTKPFHANGSPVLSLLHYGWDTYQENLSSSEEDIAFIEHYFEQAHLKDKHSPFGLFKKHKHLQAQSFLNLTHQIAAYNRHDLLQWILKPNQGMPLPLSLINMPNDKGQTPLMTAASENNLESLATLLQAGAQINARDHQGYSALMHAISQKEEGQALYLLSQGARVHFRDQKGVTALMLACYLDCSAVIDYFETHLSPAAFCYLLHQKDHQGYHALAHTTLHGAERSFFRILPFYPDSLEHVTRRPFARFLHALPWPLVQALPQWSMSSLRRLMNLSLEALKVPSLFSKVLSGRDASSSAASSSAALSSASPVSSSLLMLAIRHDVPHIVSHLLHHESHLYFSQGFVSELLVSASHGHEQASIGINLKILLSFFANRQAAQLPAPEHSHLSARPSKVSTISQFKFGGRQRQTLEPTTDELGLHTVHAEDSGVSPQFTDTAFNVSLRPRHDSLPSAPSSSSVASKTSPAPIDLVFDHPATAALVYCSNQCFHDTARLFTEFGADINALNAEGRSPIMTALYLQQWEQAEYFLSHGARLDILDPKDEHALLWPLVYENEALFKRLLSAFPSDQLSAAVSHLSGDGQSVLSLICHLNYREALKAILTHQPDLSFLIDGKQTALHLAIELGRTELAIDLIEAGAPLESQDYHSQTPLHLAAAKGLSTVINTLLDHGAQLETQSNRGLTALSLSITNSKDESLTRLLLERGANPNPLSAAELLNPLTVSIIRTPLMFACELVNPLPSVELLLSYGADVHARDKLGQSAMHYASFNRQHGDRFTFEPLVQAGADLNAKDLQGNTPLLITTFRGFRAQTLRLLELGADIHPKNAKGYNALHLLLQEGQSCNGYYSETIYHECLRLFGSHGGEDYMNTYTGDGQTPLHLASTKFFDQDDLTILIHYGARVYLPLQQRFHRDSPYDKAYFHQHRLDQWSFFKKVTLIPRMIVLGHWPFMAKKYDWPNFNAADLLDFNHRDKGLVQWMREVKVAQEEKEAFTLLLAQTRPSYDASSLASGSLTNLQGEAIDVTDYTFGDSFIAKAESSWMETAQEGTSGSDGAGDSSGSGGSEDSTGHGGQRGDGSDAAGSSNPHVASNTSSAMEEPAPPPRRSRRL